MLEHDVIDGARAQELIEDPTLEKMFIGLEKQYVTSWQTTNAKDNDERERLYHALSVLQDIKVHLRVMADNGQLAQEHLKRLKRGK
jgi:hypothetical protein